MAYNPLSLAEIYGQADSARAADQRSQLAALQIQQAQKGIADQNSVDALLKSNPNASLSDFVKLGTPGIDAFKGVSAARNTDLTDQYRQTYLTAGQVASAADPITAAKQLAPKFVQDFESAHGPGTFAQLSPDQVRQLAAGLQQHAINGLVDPKTTYEAQQKAIEDHYKQEGPGGELARNQNTIAAENARAQATQAAENTRAAASRTVTMRGQDLANADRGIPAGYERDPNTPGSLRPIAGGPHDPNAVSAGMDSRSSVMFNRVAASANEAVQALKNIAELPITTSSGWFGSAQPDTTLMGSVKSALAQKITSEEAQGYKTMIAGVSRSLSTIETAGLAPNGSITHSMDSITLNEGDTQLTRLRKLAETRQIIEKGIEPNLSNPKLAPPQRELINKIIADVQQAIPFTQHDITQLQRSKNPQATIMDFAKQQGLPSAPRGTSPIKITGDADYAKLPSGATYIGPDGQTRTKR